MESIGSPRWLVGSAELKRFRLQEDPPLASVDSVRKNLFEFKEDLIEADNENVSGYFSQSSMEMSRETTHKENKNGFQFESPSQVHPYCCKFYFII